MRRTLGVCLLLLLLTGSAGAGIMGNDAPAPAPSQSQPTNTVQEPTTEGEIPNDRPDSLTQIALELLALLPSLL